MIILMEGFDGYSAASTMTARGWALTNSAYLALLAAAGPFGGKSLEVTSRVTGGMPNIRRALPVAPSGTLLRVAFWIRTTSAFTGNLPGEPNAYFLALENSGGTSLWDVGLNDFGGVYVKKTDNGRDAASESIRGISTQRVVDTLWHHVQIEVTLASGSTGSLKIWVDGELDFEVTNAPTTLNATNFNAFTHVRLSCCRDNNTAQMLELDDLLIWDDRTPGFSGALPRGFHRVSTLEPSNAGFAADFTPSSGSNYANVDELAVDSDTTYNETGVQNNRDLHQFTNLPTNTGTIFGVSSVLRSRSVAGTPSVATKLRSSSTEAQGAAFALTTSYATQETIFETNPVTSSVWTAAEVDAADFGYVKTDASADLVRVTRQFIEVAHDNPSNEEIRVSRQYIEILLDETAPPSSPGGTISTTVIM